MDRPKSDLTENPMPKAPICITVLAHNEEGRIARCLSSLPLGDANAEIHVVVNGSSDNTAEVARAEAAKTSNLIVHEYKEGGKSRSWNQFIFSQMQEFHLIHVFVDGDAEVLPGSIHALCMALDENEHANAASALPMNGRRVDHYKNRMRLEHGLFGDLYALRGRFLQSMKDQGIRLPEDLIGDDGLLAAMAKTNLANEDDWQDQRVVICEQAGFLCEPVSLLKISSWKMQYKRMTSYSVRHFQNRIISNIMRSEGPAGLPAKLSSLYRQQLPIYQPRGSFPEYWFDRIALKRMANSAL